MTNTLRYPYQPTNSGSNPNDSAIPQHDTVQEEINLLLLFEKYSTFFELVPDFHSDRFTSQLGKEAAKPHKIEFAKNFKKLVDTIDETDEDLATLINTHFANPTLNSRPNYYIVSAPGSANTRKPPTITEAATLLVNTYKQIMQIT